MSQQSSSQTSLKPSISERFGFATANFAAAVGVGQAEQTVNKATEVLDCECSLQKEFAEQMGGIKTPGSTGPAPVGIIEMEFNQQMSSAHSAANALDASATGSFDAAIAGGAGLIGSGIAGGMAYKDNELDEDRANAEDLQSKLNDENSTSNSTQPSDLASNPSSEEMQEIVTSTDEISTDTANNASQGASNQPTTATLTKVPHDDTRASDRDSNTSADTSSTQNVENEANAIVQEWVGNPLIGKDPYFSRYESKPNSLQKEKSLKRAIEKLENDPVTKETVKSNLKQHIRNKIIQNKQIQSQNWQNYTSMTNMASQSGQGAAKARGEQNQATATLAQQEADARANIYKSTEQTVDGQFSKAAQRASEDQQQIASTLQNIAFPA